MKLFKVSRRSFSIKKTVPVPPKYDTSFIEPIEDFNFDTEFFARLSMKLANQETFKNYDEENEKSIQSLIKIAGAQVSNPFELVEKDLIRTKEFAMKNIVS